LTGRMCWLECNTLTRSTEAESVCRNWPIFGFGAEKVNSYLWIRNLGFESLSPSDYGQLTPCQLAISVYVPYSPLFTDSLCASSHATERVPWTGLLISRVIRQKA